jgi:hypothetical protein
MANYSARILSADGRTEKYRAFVCETDADAIVWAKHLLDNRTIELWSDGRLVQRLMPPATPNPDNSITHIIVNGRMIAKAGK